MNLVNFACPPDMAVHLEAVFRGEYYAQAEFAGPPTIIDVGANVGAFGRWARQVWEGCYVHAYEPNPKCQRLLAKNLARMADGYEIHAVAVLGGRDIETGEPRPRSIRLFQGKNNLGEASIYAEAAGQTDESVDVPVMFASELPQGDILKADCEGPEREIVAEYLATHAPPALVMVEYHSGGESKRLQRHLDARGYRLVKALEYEVNRGVLVWRYEPQLAGDVQ